jgi:hypothetical protein
MRLCCAVLALCMLALCMLQVQDSFLHLLLHSGCKACKSL